MKYNGKNDNKKLNIMLEGNNKPENEEVYY